MKIERISWIVIAVAIAVLAFSFNSKKNIVTKYLPGDTVFSYIEVSIPEPYDTIMYNTDTLWLPGENDTVKITDTVFVYNDYFKMYEYKIDTSSDEIDIHSEIFITQNRLYKYKINTKNNRKTEVLMPRRNRFGVGVIAGVDIMSPVISYEFNKHQVGVGYNVLSSSPVFTYQYKFSFRKNE